MQARRSITRLDRLRRRLIPLTAVVSVTACAVGPDYVPPETAVPDAWHVALTRGLATGQSDLQTWWTVFDDALLTSLVDRAVHGNLDLQRSVARVHEARARRGIAEGEWFPGIDGVAAIERARTSKEISLRVPAPQTREDTFQSIGFDSSWEIDVFGRIRRSIESADASLDASVEDYRDVLVTLLADVARSYLDVRTLQERIRVTRENIETQSKTLSLVRDRNSAGLVGLLDVRQAELNLARTESVLPAFETGLAAAIHRLGVLLGEHPSTLYVELSPVRPIPNPPAAVLLGLPTDLLRQRPDVRRSERELAAQTARIGVATADLYPRFALLGTFAFEATDFADWIIGRSVAYGVGPSVRWNIFDGGRIRSSIRAEEAVTEQALIGYENTVLGALEEVENSFVAYGREHERRDALARSSAAAASAVVLVKQLYELGLTDFQNVQDSERALFVEQDSLADSTGEVSKNVVNIYRALGGGWSP